MNLRFSVVTVVLGDLNGLRKTRDSVQCQSYEQVEWIIRDGGSGVEMLSYLESLNGNVIWSSEADRGIYDAMNHGISMCTGDFVVFMNAGDVFYDNTILAQVATVLSEGGIGADILFGGARLYFPTSGRSAYRPPRLAENSIWHGIPANHQATFYRKELVESTPYDLQYRLCGDYYLAAKLYCNGAHFKYMDKPLVTFEVGGQSYTNRKRLFIEPYLIQRDVLRFPFYSRLLSIIKRFFSTAGFVLLSQPIFRNR